MEAVDPGQEKNPGEAQVGITDALTGGNGNGGGQDGDGGGGVTTAGTSGGVHQEVVEQE